MANINGRKDPKFVWMSPTYTRVSEGTTPDPPGSFNPLNRHHLGDPDVGKYETDGVDYDRHDLPRYRHKSVVSRRTY